MVRGVGQQTDSPGVGGRVGVAELGRGRRRVDRGWWKTGCGGSGGRDRLGEARLRRVVLGGRPVGGARLGSCQLPWRAVTVGDPE